MSDKPYDPLGGAGGQALRDMQTIMEDIALPAPPGMRPKPWKAQVMTFLQDLPDLLTDGPRAQEIEATHGPGAADEYVDGMLKEIARGRERRSRGRR